MFRTMLWVSLLVLGAVYGICALATVDHRGDEVRIRSLITDTTSAIGKRNLGGTVACLSQNYSDETGLNYDRLRLIIAQSLRIDTPYTARADIRGLEIEGEDAVVQVHGVVEAVGGGDLYARDLTLHLKKEPTRHMGIVPTRVWRVVRVDNLGLRTDPGF